MLKIRVTLKGRFVGTHTFNKDVVTVGRDPASDIHLDNVNVAREHLRFEFGPSGYYKLVDLGSGKGTFLNDEQVTRGYVYNNDVVRIGQYTLSIGFEAARYNVG
jgi:pSer/pThr/pTyr-binding forkhead associated (FHA) protein